MMAGFVPFVDNFVHVSGLLSGFMAGLFLIPFVAKRSFRSKLYYRLGGMIIRT